ncbi:MAG: Imm50 family immunity protein [Solirubrobacteraceae bacterium]
MVDVFNREALEERFGRWPSFHDAEVQAVRLDSGQRADGKPSVELDVHVFDADGLLPDGRVNFIRHMLATLRFEGAEAIVLDGFGPQNVLDDLVIEDIGNHAPGAGRMLVSLPSNNGLKGSLRCEHVVVVGACDFEPGPPLGVSLSVALGFRIDRDAKRLRVSQDRVYAVTEIWRRRRRRDGTVAG